MPEVDPNLADDRTSPLGLWMYADSYLDAASCVAAHAKHPHREPVYLLYAHAVEFALKAFLRAKGVSIDEIETHGHRLAPLLDACRVLGFQEPPHIAKAGAAAVGLLELGDPDARYVRSGFKRRPDLPGLRLFAEWLITETKALCVPRGQARKSAAG
ncbi:MAG TPA: hypothetical protein VKZ79_20955 [Alphaproteobacteria bacterium]|nr:hypothetical protein [Alphaproteobacteria bacterium]